MMESNYYDIKKAEKLLWESEIGLFARLDLVYSNGSHDEITATSLSSSAFNLLRALHSSSNWCWQARWVQNSHSIKFYDVFSLHHHSLVGRTRIVFSCLLQTAGMASQFRWSWSFKNDKNKRVVRVKSSWDVQFSKPRRYSVFFQAI